MLDIIILTLLNLYQSIKFNTQCQWHLIICKLYIQSKLMLWIQNLICSDLEKFGMIYNKNYNIKIPINWRIFLSHNLYSAPPYHPSYAEHFQIAKRDFVT